MREENLFLVDFLERVGQPGRIARGQILQAFLK